MRSVRALVGAGCAGLATCLAACLTTGQVTPATDDVAEGLGPGGSSAALGGGAGAAGGGPGAGAEEEAGPLVLAFAGDVHFEGAFADVPSWERATLGPMSEQLRSADLAMVNLEAAVTERERPARKELEDPGNRYWFASPPEAFDVLARSGVDVVTVANNHGADYGVGGVRDTVAAAASAPLAVVGAGLDAAQAYTPFRTTVRGTDVAVLAADASPRESAAPVWEIAPGSGPGIAAARPGERAQLLRAVREAAAVDDLVVVYLHWGDEGNACPTPAQRTLAAALADAGADVVVGTHAHVPLGAGVLDGTYVSYGLGNFFWYHGILDETGVLRLRVQDGEVVGDQWVPGVIRPAGGNPQPLAGGARAAAVREWRALRGCTDLAPGPGEAAAAALPAYEATVRPVGPALRARMTGSSHDPARCPVPLADLRHLRLSYVDFDGAAQTGELVVHRDVADDVVRVFGQLYRARFPIARMRLVDDYGGDDDRSMAANNTSAYNCRSVAGQTGWSRHAYGRAVDINPVQNPYVSGQRVSPPAARAYLDRSVAAPGVVVAGDVVTRAFAAVGWTWGGTWADPDYQHFDTAG